MDKLISKKCKMYLLNALAMFVANSPKSRNKATNIRRINEPITSKSAKYFITFEIPVSAYKVPTTPINRAVSNKLM